MMHITSRVGAFSFKRAREEEETEEEEGKYSKRRERGSSKRGRRATNHKNHRNRSRLKLMFDTHIGIEQAKARK